jgi:hypothetical protein
MSVGGTAISDTTFDLGALMLNLFLKIILAAWVTTVVLSVLLLALVRI